MKTSTTTDSEVAAVSLIVLRLVQHLHDSGVLSADAARNIFAESARSFRAAGSPSGAALAGSLLDKLEVTNG